MTDFATRTGFIGAGLPLPDLIAGATWAADRTGSLRQRSGAYAKPAARGGTVGMVSASEAQIETLAERIRDEAVTLNGMAIRHLRPRVEATDISGATPRVR